MLEGGTHIPSAHLEKSFGVLGDDALFLKLRGKPQQLRRGNTCGHFQAPMLKMTSTHVQGSTQTDPNLGFNWTAGRCSWCTTARPL